MVELEEGWLGKAIMEALKEYEKIPPWRKALIRNNPG